METSRNGVFACGNVVHIHDLVDFVSAEAALAGRHAGRYATGHRPPADNVRLQPGANVAYCVPAHRRRPTGSTSSTCACAGASSTASCASATPDGDVVHERRLRYVVPAEMVDLTLRPSC